MPVAARDFFVSYIQKLIGSKQINAYLKPARAFPGKGNQRKPFLGATQTCGLSHAPRAHCTADCFIQRMVFKFVFPLIHLEPDK